MVARLLHLVGFWLGDDDEIIPPAPDNPEGFWENVHLVGLNDILLARLGGTWDVPPALPSGWETAPAFDDLALAADELCGRLAAHGHWAWKDPRNSLTLPFWRRIVPDVRVVVCLRNPLEVVRSLATRDGIPLGDGFRLWETYYARVLADAPLGRYLVTDYARWFVQPAAELARLLAFVDLVAPADVAERALTIVTPCLRHHRVALPDLLAAGAPGSVIALYAGLCAAATADAAVTLRVAS